MTTISDKKLHALDVWLMDEPQYDENDLRILRQNRENLHRALCELLTARSYIPKLQEGIQGNVETISKLNVENHNLEQTARVYAEQQAKMIDEIRELKDRLAQRDYTIDEISRRFLDDEEALRWIWAILYRPRSANSIDEHLLENHSMVRQTLAAVGLPAPERQ